MKPIFWFYPSVGAGCVLGVGVASGESSFSLLENCWVLS